MTSPPVNQRANVAEQPEQTEDRYPTKHFLLGNSKDSASFASRDYLGTAFTPRGASSLQDVSAFHFKEGRFV